MTWSAPRTRAIFQLLHEVVFGNAPAVANGPPCVFCNPPADRIFHRSPQVIGLWDAFPVTEGHALLLTTRHIESWFEATEAEQQALTSAIRTAHNAIVERFGAVLAFNLGVNVGAAAGQTIPHVHLHVIPRREGDVPDPRGGVRHVIPSKANYLASPTRERTAPLVTGGHADPFSRHVLPLFDRSTDIAIVAAFIQESGLQRIKAALASALARGVRLRIITGDYLEITQATALEQLLDYERTSPLGTIETRIVKVAELPDRNAFHPKSWRFESPGFGIAFVGSSNLSRSALDTGIEWNLRVEQERDAEAYARVSSAFDELWRTAHPLDEQWIAEYAERARIAPPQERGELTTEPLERLPTPHAAQLEALHELRKARREGRRRALVVFATGLGKTLLAAFDWQQLCEELKRPPRLLFVAHRKELLMQASLTYRRMLREHAHTARVSWFVEERSDLSGDLVFASVLKLARPEHLERLRATKRFDYVVIDEVHHAAADSYRRILGALEPGFLLGLTATPDRADAADILGLFDDHVAHRADVGRGIALKRLAPFHYFGIKDEIDYSPANIPWRNRRFDPDALAKAAETDARMQTLWRAWGEHAGRRSLVFCCSVEHAMFVRGWLRERGVRVSAVFAAEGSDDRETALRELERGELDAVCAVDVFNEGIDVPSIDRVVMLRPTESSVVFLQQLGRGLRASPEKEAVTIIDFVGNHRVFLDRVRALLSLAEGEKVASLRELLEAAGPVELPAGCSVDIELEAKELLTQLFNVGGANEVERAYRELRAERGERPTAGELYRMRYLPSVLRERHGSWFGFVQTESDLAVAEQRCFVRGEAFLRELETTAMTKCFKMVTVEALLERDKLFEGMPLAELAHRSREILNRTPELKADIREGEGTRWEQYWRRNPIDAWISGTWFRLDGERFHFGLQVPTEDQATFASMVRELVDLRLAQYRARQPASSTEGFTAKVTWNQRDPILKLPSGVARGETDVRLSDGSVWQFRFAAQYCNVARPVGTQENHLPDLLRRWFGPRAGHPGTAFQVRFRASPDGLWAEPIGGAVLELSARRGVVAYPDLRAAAGAVRNEPSTAEPERVVLPVPDDRELFAVRVSGDSMDGGREPLRDGDWAVMRVSRHAPAGAMENRVVLVQVDQEQFQIKRLRRDGERWALTSDAPSGPTFAASSDTVPVARLERVVHPEDLAPAVGTAFSAAEVEAHFGIEGLATKSGRYGGHLFVFIDRKKQLVAPDQVRVTVERPRPSETAFVLAKKAGAAWRYLGVARRRNGETTWQLPAVDFATWKQWGEGRDVSRRLEDNAVASAAETVDVLIALPEADRWVTQPDGRRARILGKAKQGGVRIDGGRGGFAERTVSLVDVAWVLAAREDARVHGGLVDEERVNRLRYLEGTPRGSTRWVDTGWALACVAKVKS